MPVLIRVSVSRKLTRDYQSRGFALDITSELPATAAEDPNQMARASQHLFQLAEDLLQEQVSQAGEPEPANGNGRQAPPTPQEESPRPGNSHNGISNGRSTYRGSGQGSRDGNGHAGHNGNGRGADRSITEAQVRALDRMAKRLDTTGERIAQDEHNCGLRQLSLKQASALIDSLKNSIEANQGASR
jgi:hypothetical protein